MTVKAILSLKGTDVATIHPTATISEAAKKLTQRRIGCLVITGADNRVVGIVSERDIVRALAAHGSAALDMMLSDVMTRKVVTCHLGEHVGAIMERITAGKFRHVPVIEEGRLVGIVSIGDVVNWRLREMEHEQSALREYIQHA